MLHVHTRTIATSLSLLCLCAAAAGQSTVLFNFDTAPLYTPLPLDVVAGGVTAHLSATGAGFSIQGTGTAPVVPVGFTGRFIYPSSVFAADLVIDFSQTLTGFSIQYSPHELGCDDSARMRVTATMNGAYVGTNTAIASNPGTWPVATLACTFPQGFNHVVVHYDAPPPTCQDYGVIFIADNMTLTLGAAGSYTPFGAGCVGSGGVPVLTASAPPAIGHDSVIALQNPPAGFALGIGLLGFSNTTFGGAPLPADMTGLGMPGCWLLVEPASLWGLVPQSGSTQWTLPIPITQGTVGLHFYLQALLLDPQVPDPANTFLAIMTNALTGVVGY